MTDIDSLIISSNNQLLLSNNKIIIMGDNANVDGAFWRFAPLLDQDVSVMISRDCDSRLNDKEFKAVQSWLNHPAQFHCMRDHVNHSFPPVLAGMWGCKNDGILNPRWLFKYLQQFKNNKYGDDQNGLFNFYKMHSNLFLEHDDLQRFNGIKFPTYNPFTFGSFIGERITSEDKPGRL